MWKKNDTYWRCLLDTLAIALDFRTIVLKTAVAACCLLLALAAKIQCSPWTPKRVVKPPLGKTQLGNQHFQLGLSWVLIVHLDLIEKKLTFTSKWTTAWYHGMREASLNGHSQSFESPIFVEEEQPSLETRAWHTGDRSKLFRRIVLKTGCKRSFFNTESAIWWARQLKMTQNLFPVMRISSVVILSYLDVDFEPQCPQK